MLNKLNKPVFRDLIIILAIFWILEVFFFNARSFVTFGLNADDIVSVRKMPSANITLNGVEKNPDGYVASDYGSIKITFPENSEQKLAGIFLDIDFSNGMKSHDFTIKYSDEEHSNRVTRAFRVIENAEGSQYITLQAHGNITEIEIRFSDKAWGLVIKDIVLNKAVPFRFMVERWMLFSLATLAVVSLIRSGLLKKRIDKDCGRQTLLFKLTTLGFITYLLLLTLFSTPFDPELSLMQNLSNDGEDQFNALIVDALIDGQFHLNIEPSDTLQSLKNPYDGDERNSAGVYFEGWDLAYYNGQFYSYFGIVQVLVLSLPFKLLTGAYFPTKLAVFIFASGAAIYLMFIWQHLAFRFMKKMSVGMFTLGQIALPMCAMVHFVTARPRFYEVAGTSALFFTAAGLYLILRYSEGRKLSLLFFGCLFMALAVGCRPNFVFASFLVPIILWDKIKELWGHKKDFTFALMSALVPYIAVAAGLMWYNYVRFDSVLEFGNKYMLTVTNVGAAGLLSPINRLILVGAFLFSFIVPALNWTTAFPFISLEGTYISDSYSGYVYKENVLGILILPIIWALAGIVRVFKYNFNYSETKSVVVISEKRSRFKRRRRKTGRKVGAIQTFTFTDSRRKLIARFILALPIIGLVQMVVMSFIGLATRYQLDFLWLFSLAGLLCGYFLVEMLNKTIFAKTARRIYNGGMFACIVIMGLLVISSSDGAWLINHNPWLYYNFKEFIGVIPL
ncbi:MAG: hypothetical protein FWG83_06195 [Oscillospiraceae bacterium]|nr:hypothetical protein [Oscillospiraceae bacterium]